MVLNHLSVDFEPGSISGLIGINGSGKTTFLNCLSRFISPKSGSIHFQTHDLCKLSQEEISRLGISRSFQNVTLIPYLSVLKNLVLGLYTKNEISFAKSFFYTSQSQLQDRKFEYQAQELLQFLGAARNEFLNQAEGLQGQILEYPDPLDLMDAPAGILPYGIQRIISLLQCLINKPKLILLDEPTAGLEQADVNFLIHFIKKWANETHATVVIVEHNLEVVSRLCTHLYFLSNGKITTYGSPERVFQNREVIETYLGTKIPTVDPNWATKLYRHQLSPTDPGRIEKLKTFVRVKNLAVKFGSVHAVSNVNLDIKAGSVCGLVGGNGAGKSTTLKALSGLIQSGVRGHILIEDEEITYESSRDRTQLGIFQMLEGGGFFQGITVEENLSIGISRQAQLKNSEFTDFLYSKFPMLYRKRAQRADGLSGGEKRILGIARLFLKRPRLAIVDEPSLGLSPIILDQIADVIETIQENFPMSWLIAESNYVFLERIADYIYLIENGVSIKNNANLSVESN